MLRRPSLSNCWDNELTFIRKVFRHEATTLVQYDVRVHTTRAPKYVCLINVLIIKLFVGVKTKYATHHTFIIYVNLYGRPQSKLYSRLLF